MNTLAKEKYCYPEHKDSIHIFDIQNICGSLQIGLRRSSYRTIHEQKKILVLRYSLICTKILYTFYSHIAFFNQPFLHEHHIYILPAHVYILLSIGSFSVTLVLARCISFKIHIKTIIIRCSVFVYGHNTHNSIFFFISFHIERRTKNCACIFAATETHCIFFSFHFILRINCG